METTVNQRIDELVRIKSKGQSDFESTGVLVF